MVVTGYCLSLGFIIVEKLFSILRFVSKEIRDCQAVLTEDNSLTLSALIAKKSMACPKTSGVR